LIGEILGQKYKLVRLLGQGGMGAVYEAVQTDTLDRVAVKVLHDHLLDGGGEGGRRFHREVRAISRIQSEHIVRVLDAGTDEATGRLYLVTEYLAGEDLQRLMDRIGPLSPEGAVRIVIETLRGLAKAHAARVIHRDIKPANLFVTRGPGSSLKVKILDFGIAKLGVEPLGLGPTTNLTVTGGLLGSPLYMSPEQVQDSRNVDPRSDLWSIGCVLYAALSGRAPHQHLTSLGQLLVAICVARPPSLLEVAPWVSPELAEVAHRALEIRPEARYADAEAMLAALERFVPPASLDEEMLVSSRGAPRIARPSSLPPSAVVRAAGTDHPLRGDEPTELAGRSRALLASATLGSEVDRFAPREPERAVRSAVPRIAGHVSKRHVTVDPRRFLGEKSELWTFSLDVHRHLASLIARIWKALRRGGSQVPPMTYGTQWVLYEPRTGRVIVDDVREGGERKTLEEAGIRPAAVLWVLAPADVPKGN
jgi:serine/threonine-protein kinase